MAIPRNLNRNISLPILNSRFKYFSSKIQFSGAAATSFYVGVYRNRSVGYKDFLQGLGNFFADYHFNEDVAIDFLLLFHHAVCKYFSLDITFFVILYVNTVAPYVIDSLVENDSPIIRDVSI